MSRSTLADVIGKAAQYTVTEPMTPDGVPDGSGIFVEFRISEESLNAQIIDLCYRRENE